MELMIKLIETHNQPTLVLRTISPVEKLPEFLGMVYGSIMEYLGEMREMPSGMPFAAYHNIDMAALDVEAGFPVNKGLPGKGEILSGVIPAGKYITTIHEGAYDSVGPAYDQMAEWTKENGYEPAGIAYEYYLNDPTEDPSIIPLTEIRFPVKEKS